MVVVIMALDYQLLNSDAIGFQLLKIMAKEEIDSKGSKRIKKDIQQWKIIWKLFKNASIRKNTVLPTKQKRKENEMKKIEKKFGQVEQNEE